MQMLAREQHAADDAKSQTLSESIFKFPHSRW